MRKFILTTISFLMLSLPGFITPAPSYALDELVVMFFGQKEFPESLSRKSRVFKRTMAEVVEVLQQDYDLEIKNETVASMDTYDDRGGRRSKAEIAEVARQSGADVAVIFVVTPWMEGLRGHKKIKGQITIEAFFVDASARQAGYVDVSTEIPVLVRAPFKKAQVAEAAGEAVKDIAAQAAEELGEQLLAHVDRREEVGGIFTLVFRKFSINELEDTLDAFSQVDGYASHRQIKKTARSAKVEYNSTADMSALTSEFELILDDLGIRVTTSSRGNSITFSKTRIRRSRR